VLFRAFSAPCIKPSISIAINVHHLPPGTSKWNKIEHRLFSFVTMNWRAKPPVSYRVVVDLISATTTDSGLTVACELDTNLYPKGTVVNNEEMAQINILRADSHGEWNHAEEADSHAVEPAYKNNNSLRARQKSRLTTDEGKHTCSCPGEGLCGWADADRHLRLVLMRALYYPMLLC
jgi:hypothetical protein